MVKGWYVEMEEMKSSENLKNYHFALISVIDGCSAPIVLDKYPALVNGKVFTEENLNWDEFKDIRGVTFPVLIFNPNNNMENFMKLMMITKCPLVINPDTPANWIKKDFGYPVGCIQIFEQGEDLLSNYEEFENDDYNYEGIEYDDGSY
jgi:hypothetical protein